MLGMYAYVCWLGYMWHVLESEINWTSYVLDRYQTTENVYICAYLYEMWKAFVHYLTFKLYALI